MKNNNQIIQILRFTNSMQSWSNAICLKLKPFNTQLILLSLLILMAFYSTTLWAQRAEINFNNLSTEHGLSNRHVRKIVQDKQGFIWIATQNGLFRYDGYEFKEFKHNPEDNKSLASNYIQNLFVDSKDVLWVSMWPGGFAQYHQEKENFTNYQFDVKNSNSLSRDEVMAITEDINGDLWIATWGGGLNHYNRKRNLFTHYRHDPQDPGSISDDFVFSLLMDSKGILWSGTRFGGLNRFDKKSGNFIRYQHKISNPNSLSSSDVNTIYEDIDGIIWIGTSKGLDRFDPSNESFQHYMNDTNNPYSLSSNSVSSIFRDADGYLWIGTYGGGLNLFDQANNRFERHVNNPQDKSSLSNNSIVSIIQSHNGQIWLGTAGGGISNFDTTSFRFGLVKHIPSKPNSLSKGEVHAIFKDKAGILWIGTESGLNRYDEASDQFQHYQHNQKNPHSLSSNYVSVIFEDTTGSMWIGTIGGGLNKLNRQDDTFTHYQHHSNDVNRLSSNNIQTIHQDNRGNIWIGTWNGLNRFNLETENITHFKHSENSPTSLSQNIITSLYTAKDGSLWVGTGKGINQFVHESQSFKRYQNDPQNPNSLSHNQVHSIAQDKQGILWFGTAGGLNRFDAHKETFVHYRDKDGLSADRVMAIFPDGDGKLWLGIGDNGFSLFDPETVSIVNNIGSEAGCADEQSAWFTAYFQAEDGQIIFGSDGFCSFYPKQAFQISRPPKIVFTDFRLLNKSVPIQDIDAASPLSRSINYTKSITLNYTDNLISFEFAALHYSDPKNNQYQYKLEGFNQNWIETNSNNRRASFTNLSSGNYILRIKASNNQGIWNEQGRSIKLHILPAPWQTWWAYSIYGMLLLSLIGLFIRAQHNKVLFERKINEQLEDKVVERTTELQQANEQLEELSLTDLLTGLKNRRFLLNNLKGDIDLVLRNYYDHKLNNNNQMIKESDLIFFLIDLDHFKKVNDVYGHTAGDAVLIQIKSILEQVFRETDYLVRWGGEEFLVIARYSDRDRAPELAERLRREVELHDFDIGQGQSINKTCSIGYSCFPFLIDKPECINWERIIDIADHCLYAAKNSNRNAWVGLENVDCDEDNLFFNVTEKTNDLINSKQLKVTTSTSIIDNIKWS